jgi:hypothetical protein
VALLICALAATGQPNSVKLVNVKSIWGGLDVIPAKPEHDPARGVELLVQSQGENRFYSNGAPVSANVIEALVQALGAPTVEQPRSSNLGITQRWLDDNVEGARRKNDPLSRYSSDFYWPAFKGTFTNRSLIETVPPSLFSGMHTDDYPRVDLQVVFANGDAWSAASDSQYEFMIPWRVKVPGRTFTTWNANLSKAIAALLPDRAVNRGRLNGESFSYMLGNAALSENSWEACIYGTFAGFLAFSIVAALRLRKATAGPDPRKANATSVWLRPIPSDVMDLYPSQVTICR